MHQKRFKLIRELAFLTPTHCTYWCKKIDD